MGLLRRVRRREEIARKTLANTLITLRNAQVRRISWVRGVRPARGGASGLLITPFRPATILRHHPEVAAKRPSKDVTYTGPVVLRSSRSLSSGRPLRAGPVGSHLRVSGREAYLILYSRNSTCFLATGSYF